MHTTYRHWQAYLTSPQLWLGRPRAERLAIIEAARESVSAQGRPCLDGDWVQAQPAALVADPRAGRGTGTDQVMKLAGPLGAADPFTGEGSEMERLAVYLRAHLEPTEISFLMPFSSSGPWHVPAVLEHVSCSGPIDPFLRGRAPGWESALYSGGTRACLSSPAVMECAQTLLRRVKASPTPLPLSALTRGLDDVPVERLARAVVGLMRYLLVFAGLDPETHEPRLGLWPALSAWLHRSPAVLPPAAEPVEVFHRPLMIEDLTTLLGAVAARAPRLKAKAFDLYARDRTELEAALPAVPEWAQPYVTEPGRRISEAIEIAVALKLARVAADRESGGRRLDPRPELGAWLAATTGERFRRLSEVLAMEQDRYPSPGAPPQPRLLPEPPELRVVPGYRLVDATESVRQSWGRLSDGGFRPVEGCLEHLARSHGPLARLLIRGEGLRGAVGWSSMNPDGRLAPEAVERLEHVLVRSFLVRRLVPLGGARLGRTADGTVVCELTEAGRFMLGQAREFTLPEPPAGAVVVQPDFEIVFLGPNGQAEAELGRFCARVGHGQGAVLRISREACLQAAKTGLTAAEAVTLLERYSAKPVPANIRHEVQGWFGLARTVKSRRTILFECPDPETAARLTGALRRDTQLLNPTTVEFTGGKLSTAQRNRLQAAGVFVTSSRGG